MCQKLLLGSKGLGVLFPCAQNLTFSSLSSLFPGNVREVKSQLCY